MTSVQVLQQEMARLIERPGFPVFGAVGRDSARADLDIIRRAGNKSLQGFWFLHFDRTKLIIIDDSSKWCLPFEQEMRSMQSAIETYFLDSTGFTKVSKIQALSKAAKIVFASKHAQYLVSQSALHNIA